MDSRAGFNRHHSNRKHLRASMVIATLALLLLGLFRQAVQPVDVAAAGNWMSVASGRDHTCGLKTTGAVQCWGLNDRGQLGDGTFSSASLPQDVVGLSSGVTAITAGGYHSCALLTGGAVKCWGEAGSGQLGNGASIIQNSPVQVSGLSSGTTAIQAGDTSTCAIVSGAAKCWGSNNAGQLGDNSTTARNAPVQVSGLTSGVTGIVAGDLHGCALVSGGAMCWGGGGGLIGNGSNSSSLVPVAVTGLSSGVQQLAASGGATCARSGGAVKCWGINFQGQFGSGNNSSSNIPVAIAALSSNVSNLDGGGTFTCYVVLTAMRCSGSNESGQLGDGTTINSLLPVAVVGLSNVTALSAGRSHTCAITSGVIKCWGKNTNGQLGNGRDSRRRDPVVVPALAGATWLTAGTSSSCAVLGASALCWGSNYYGELGDGTLVSRSTPAPVSGLSSGVTRIAAGYFHACAIVNGGAKCWGNNLWGQLGLGLNLSWSTTPVDVKNLSSGVQQVDAGGYETRAIVSGALKCWGSDSHGQLGNGAAVENMLEPGDVVGLSSGVSDVSVGRFHVCAVVNGGAMCWGRNDSGQLGIGSNTGSDVPAQVLGLTTGVVAVAAGESHSCALMTGGAMKCWGLNSSGQVGDGSTTTSDIPVDIAGSANPALSVDAGNAHTCIATTGGVVRCWGNNLFAQVGDGTTTTRTAAVNANLASGMLQVSTGALHSCARSTTAVYCWGSQQFGQLGDGVFGYNTMPLAVGLPLDVVGCDGNLDATDALAVLRVLAGLTGNPQPSQPCTGDVDGDSAVTINDAHRIRQLVAADPP